MVATVVLDVVLGVVLVVLLVTGIRRGIARSAGAILGLAIGGLVAYLVLPALASALPWPAWRVLATVVISILLLVAGHAAGSALGRAVAGGERARPGTLSRLLGGAMSLVVAALVVSLVTGSIARLGAPTVSQAAQESRVAAVIEQLTPDPIDAALSSLRGSVLAVGGIGETEAPVEFAEDTEPSGGAPSPSVPGSGSGDPSSAPTSPSVPNGPSVPSGSGSGASSGSGGSGGSGGSSTGGSSPGAGGSGSVAESARSVVRLVGTAYACGVELTGSGVFIASDRILTNAHVVAGVERPLVQTPDGRSAEGRVVYFDPDTDIAVIAAEGLSGTPLALDADLTPDARGTAAGYPYGGPYASSEVRVRSVGTAHMSDIYRDDVVERHIYVLAGEVSPGQSGGPVLDSDGDLVGLLFGRAAGESGTAYALTGQELRPVISAAPGLNQEVTAGRCPALAR